VRREWRPQRVYAVNHTKGPLTVADTQFNKSQFLTGLGGRDQNGFSHHAALQRAGHAVGDCVTGT